MYTVAFKSQATWDMEGGVYSRSYHQRDLTTSIMRESVLTKKPNVSVMKPMRQMEVIPFYDERLDMEMMEVLRTMQSPVDERRRVQQRVVDKHRYDSERQYWMERDIKDSERRFLRKSMSLNDIQSLSGRYPKSYLEIHQQQMDNARNESVSNSGANSSQDTYHNRQYPRLDVYSSRPNVVHHGSQPSSRLSMANMPGDNSRRETPIRYDSRQFTTRSESNNSYHPVNDIHRYSSQGPAYEDVYRNPNFSKANDTIVHRAEKGDARRMSIPLPNIKPGQEGERILVTMSPGQPDRVSIRMAQVPGIPSQSSKSSAPSPSNQSSNKVQYNSSLASSQSRTASSRQEGPLSSNSSSNSNSKNASTVNMDKSHHNTKTEKTHLNTPKMEKTRQNTPKMEKTVKRNTVKTESVEKTEKPASSHKKGSHTERSASSTRSNQRERYNRVDSDGTANTKDVERKSSLTTASVVKTNKKVAATQNHIPSRIQNIQTQQDRAKGIRKTTKEKKPQQSSLRKTNSFKVVGRSTNYFGFVSVADMRTKKKVTFSNDDSERPGTA